MSEASMRYSAPPTLARMMRSDAEIRCAVGPFGSGKSSACIMEILRRAMEQAPNAMGLRRTRWVIVRNSYRQLEDTTRKTFEHWIVDNPELRGARLGKWRESDFAFDLAYPAGDGTKVEAEILFRSLNRPGDAGKLLSLELTGAYINEAKEIPKAIFTPLKGRCGRFPSRDEGGCTWRGVIMDTNPWPVTHWGYKLFRDPPDESFQVFKQPGGRSVDAENLDHLEPGYYERLAKGADSEWIGWAVDGEYPQAEAGAIYAKLLEPYRLEAFSHPLDGVFTSWDLGFTDSTAIWFWRLNAMGGLDFVNHYEAHGWTLSHYFDIVEASGYDVVKHWLPHDAAAHTLATGVSIEDQFRSRYPGKVQIGPMLSPLDGIQAARWLLEQPCRFHVRCAEGVEALRSYHFAWDDELKTYSRKPEHDWSSHTSDAFRYAAIVAKHVMRLARAAPTPKPLDVGPVDKRWTLDQLFADREAATNKRERI